MTNPMTTPTEAPRVSDCCNAPFSCKDNMKYNGSELECVGTYYVCSKCQKICEAIRTPTENHCRDCCCARSWKALGITEYTGKSIPEHIAELKSQLTAATAQLASVLEDRAPVDALKNCPFCGASAQYEEDWDSITCAHSKDGCGFTYNCEAGFQEAAKAWNTRPATMEDRALDALEEICEAHSAYEHARNCSVRNVVEQKLAALIEAEMEARALLREAGRVK